MNPNSQTSALTVRSVRGQNAQCSVEQPTGAALGAAHKASRRLPPCSPQPSPGASLSRAPSRTASASGLRGGASGRRGRGGPGSGGRGAGSEELVMAANLSRNGPALQEAYVRVVAEKSPTNWWAPGRAGAVGGAGRGDPGSPACAPHLRRTRELPSRPRLPGRAGRESPGPRPAAVGPGPWDPVSDSVPGCAWWPRQVPLFCPGTSQPSVPEKEEATPGHLEPLCSRVGLRERPGSPRALGGLPQRRQTRNSGRGGSLGLCECGCQRLLFSGSTPTCA